MNKEFKKGTSYIPRPFEIESSRKKHITWGRDGEIVSDEILTVKYIYD